MIAGAVKRGTVAGAVAIVAMSGSLARAADYPLPGTTLSISNNGRTSKFVWVSKDATIAFPAAAPSVVGATLSVSAQDGDTATVLAKGVGGRRIYQSEYRLSLMT
ncbi:hypothetical protein L6Q96_21725 [Candidatus Binatia bacterium]|nr:hypothetical protein [Candidatus Binatia bacterium]